MANQAIALQARAPQTDILGGAVRQNNMLISQAIQQQTARRQAAQAQQSIDIAAAKEGREVAAHQVELAKNVAINFRDQLNMLPPNDLAGAEALRQQVVQSIPAWDKILPSAQQIATDPATRQRLLMKAEEIVRYSYATPVASTTMDEQGRAFSTVAGGLPGVAGAFPMQQFALDPNAGQPPAAGAAPQPPRMTPAPPVAPEVLDAAAQAIASGKSMADPALRALPPAALEEAQRRALNLRLDTMPPAEGGVQPMSMQQGQADLPRIVQTMMQTGFIPQSDFETMRQTAGPEKEAQLAQIMRDNGIQIVPDAAPQGGARDAVYRPEEGLAVLQRGAPDATLEEAQYVPTGRQFVGKSPMQAPMPGSAIVPLPRVSGESAATTAGSEGVKVKTQPQIVAGEERAKRLEKLRGDLPTARQETQTIVDNLAQRINAIDEFLRSPYRRSIIGSIEGRIPRFLQDEERADAQRLWDTITNNDVLQTILAARAQTGTGGSPLGNMSNSDLQFIIGASSPLTQTGSEAKQEQQLLKMRDKLYGKLQQAQQTFNDTYREISREAPNIRLNAPRVAPRYSAGPAAGVQRTKGGATVSNW